MSTPESRARAAFAQHIVDLMEAFASVQARGMFGGFGLYRDGLMFALTTGDRLYFKVDDEAVAPFIERGLAPLRYVSRGRTVALRYHEAPPEVYEDPAAMADWARRAYECAVRARGEGRKTPARRPSGADLSSTRAPSAELAALRNLGPRSVEMLAQAGIRTLAQLRRLGAVQAYARTRAVCPQASLNLLWALEGALSDRHWQEVADTDRASLLMALEDVQRHLG